MSPLKESNISTKPFAVEDAAGIDEIAEAALRLLKLKPLSSAAAKMNKIAEFIDEHLHKKKESDDQSLIGLASQLACLYGNILRDEMGWEWWIVKENGGEFLGIGPADKSAMLTPVGYIYSQMTAPASGDNTSMLLFNMIRAGNLPKGKPGEYVRIG